jgi:thiol-disulfide isomerase/thioredoxin
MNAVHLARRLRPFVWGVSALALVVMAVWWWSPWTDADRDGAATASNAQPALNTKPGLDLYPPEKRQPAPKLVGTTLDDKPFSLTAGDVVVINVWGSWCAPCRAETPDLVRLANEYGDQGVRFVGINTRDNPDAAKAFVRSFNVPYPSVTR